MASETEIANLALGRLGIAQFITSLAEQSTPARICNRFYHQCRREVLRDHPYGFASSAISVAQVAGQTFPGWQYVYQYPASCLMVWTVADASGIRQWCNYFGQRDPYTWQYLDVLQRRFPFKKALSSDGSRPVLLSDVPSAYAYFTADVTNTGAFTDDFVSAFAWRLAMEVGGPLKCSVDLREAARSEYFLTKSQATAQDMNEQRDDTVPESDSIACRS
jgi:hypothetical protein